MLCGLTGTGLYEILYPNHPWKGFALMKKRLLLPAAVLALVIGLCCWLLNADGICLGRIEQFADGQWSQIHAYMNEEITVDFPIEGEDRVCLFQYETGRGSFSVKITDAEGNVVYSKDTDGSGSDSFLVSSDLTLRIKGEGHGGVFSLLQREKPTQYPGEWLPTYGLREEGTYTGRQFTAAYDLRQADGKYVNFYVENYGSEPVVITINGDHSRTIEPGSSGHICAPISVAIMPQSMTLKCTATGDEALDIYWKIAQRTQNTT